MNYKLINDVEYIENIMGKLGRPKDNEKILTGHLITKLDICHEILERMDTSVAGEVEILRKTAEFMKKKNIPFAITEEESNTRWNHFYAHGKEIKATTTESKKLPSQL